MIKDFIVKTRIDQPTKEALYSYCDKNNMKMAAVLREALEYYLFIKEKELNDSKQQ